jgi:hypothetical protein
MKMKASVYPSGAALAVRSVAMTPLAPARFSMTIPCPNASDRSGAMARATASVGPPGGTPTINLTGLTG